jgi:hypothetical protein
MANQRAKLINTRLGINLFNESIEGTLELNKFTKKQVFEMYIDDLVCPVRLVPTMRLRKLIIEIGG